MSQADPTHSPPERHDARPGPCESEVASLIDRLQQLEAYPQTRGEHPVEMRETHISWVFLLDDVAYKVKKPVRNHFLDYSTLERRKHFCEQELRLDRRFAPDLYLDVVPITLEGGKPVVEGDGEAIEYAVKMRRFPDGSLLSERLGTGRLTTDEVFSLAERVADFHQSAERLDPRSSDSALGSAETVFQNAIDNFPHLHRLGRESMARTVQVLEEWTGQYFEDHRRVFAQRRHNGFVRECHGDMHLDNIVFWNDQLIPFDGIEFNDSLRWIDVIDDAAFVAMDLAARDRLDLCRSFINAYLERTGDHASLAVLRWYMVYRALVRAKVAALRAAQSETEGAERSNALPEDEGDRPADVEHLSDFEKHVDLAYRFTLPEQSGLWITHGVSGSGKTTISEMVVQSHGAIRLRSDVERKRHFGLAPTERPTDQQKTGLYSAEATRATYSRLRQMARCILRAGYPVVVDATFLERSQREMFQSLADSEGATFGILECQACEKTLRQRVADRMARGDDASDADLRVLENQLDRVEPLTPEERDHVFDIPDPATMIDSMHSSR